MSFIKMLLKVNRFWRIVNCDPINIHQQLALCIFVGMQVLVDARDKLEIPWEHPNTHLAAQQAILFHSGNELDVETFRQYAPLIGHLWQDRAIKKAYDRRREFQLVSFHLPLFARCLIDDDDVCFSFNRVIPLVTFSTS